LSSTLAREAKWVSASRMTAVSVRVSEVSKTYGPVRALRSVSLTLSTGKVTALLGPNGAGKSTLLSLVGALARPTSGRVEHVGMGSRQTVRASLGWLGHDGLLYPDLTGMENVRLSARLHGCTAEAVDAVRARFDLTAFADRPVRTCSRGQRQRVALARALVHAPLLVLLDEPTTGLDGGGVERLERVVLEEAARGGTVLVVTHDERFARAVGARVVRMEAGRLAAAAEA
jgi:heme ABC exporter ATP-binding subunit CcmA